MKRYSVITKYETVSYEELIVEAEKENLIADIVDRYCSDDMTVSLLGRVLAVVKEDNGSYSNFPEILEVTEIND